MKKTRRTFALLSFFLPILSFLFLMLLLGGLITSSAGGSSGSTTGKRTRLTAQEVAQKVNISVERAEDVIKILNWQLSKEKFTLEGASGSLANAERESGKDWYISTVTPFSWKVNSEEWIDEVVLSIEIETSKRNLIINSDISYGTGEIIKKNMFIIDNNTDNKDLDSWLEVSYYQIISLIKIINRNSEKE